jgi:hypothetical protein
LGPAGGPVGDGGDTGRAEGVAAEDGDERVLVVSGNLGVAEIADPQTVVFGNTGDHDHAVAFHLLAYAGFGGDPSTVCLSVCGGPDDEPEVVPAVAAQTLCGQLRLVVTAHTDIGGRHRPIPRPVSCWLVGLSFDSDGVGNVIVWLLSVGATGCGCGDGAESNAVPPRFEEGLGAEEDTFGVTDLEVEVRSV